VRGLRGTFGLSAAAILLAACTGTTEANRESLGASRAITREQYNDWTHSRGWPLTIDKITLSCKTVPGEGGTPVASVVVTDADGNNYGLNGVAGNTHRYRPVVEIWARHEVFDQPKNGTGLIALGIALCEGKTTAEYWPFS
jgi:hypothetical protein